MTKDYPEKIWAYGLNASLSHRGIFTDEEYKNSVEYTRSDLVERMVKEARSEGYWEGYGESEAGEDM